MTNNNKRDKDKEICEITKILPKFCDVLIVIS